MAGRDGPLAESSFPPFLLVFWDCLCTRGGCVGLGWPGLRVFLVGTTSVVVLVNLGDWVTLSHTGLSSSLSLSPNFVSK